MKKSRLLGAVCTCVLTFVGATANAALVSRLGGQAVYDTDLDITWIADANLAASNTFGTAGISPNGPMTWATANTWIGNMNAANYLGFNDWRLPTTLVPDASCITIISSGFSCTGSEMGHLFYTEFGATAGNSVMSTSNPADLARFTNVQPSLYWSAEYAPNPVFAWSFNFNNGYQGPLSKGYDFYVWAVRLGDVGVSTVPIPAAVWLFGSGLMGLLGVARCNRRPRGTGKKRT